MQATNSRGCDPHASVRRQDSTHHTLVQQPLDPSPGILAATWRGRRCEIIEAARAKRSTTPRWNPTYPTAQGWRPERAGLRVEQAGCAASAPRQIALAAQLLAVAKELHIVTTRLLS